MATVLVTGANGSLALPAVEYLLSRYPSYTTVLTVRDDSEKDSNTTTLRHIIAKFPNADSHVRKLDLSSLKTVQAFTADLRTEIDQGKIPRLAAIICNAMTWSLQSGQQFSDDGYETCMAINHLAQFSLTLRLLGQMDPKYGRIVFLSSDTHWPGKAGFEIYPPNLPDDLELLVKPKLDKQGEEVGRGFQRYALSKLVIVMTMYELIRRLKASKTLQDIRVLAIDPGALLDSRVLRASHVPQSWQFLLFVLTWLQPVLKYVKPSLRTSADAGKDVVELAVSEKFAGQEGHFEMRAKADSSPDSKNEEMQKRLWDKSVEWCGIEEKDTAL